MVGSEQSETADSDNADLNLRPQWRRQGGWARPAPQASSSASGGGNGGSGGGGGGAPAAQQGAPSSEAVLIAQQTKPIKQAGGQPEPVVQVQREVHRPLRALHRQPDPPPPRNQSVQRQQQQQQRRQQQRRRQQQQSVSQPNQAQQQRQAPQPQQRPQPAPPPAQAQQPQDPRGSPGPAPDSAAPSFVPIKSWRSCREVAEGMAALPAARLDQRLLSAALQHMVTVHERAPRLDDRRSLDRLLTLALPRLPSFDAFGLCIIVRTAARLGAPLSGADMQAWSATAERRLHSFNPQDLANSLFSVGASGQRLPPRALPAFCAAVERLAGGMKPQELSNSLLGLAYMQAGRHRDSPPHPAAEAAAVAALREAAGRLRAFNHQELANLAWALSKLTWPAACQRCERQLWALFGEAAGRAASLPPQELSNLCLAQCNLRFLHPGALSALVAAAARSARRLDEQHLDNVLLAAAQLPHSLPQQQAGAPPAAPAAGGEASLGAGGGGAAAATALPAAAVAPAAAAERGIVDPADVAALRAELLRRMGDMGRPIRGYTPTPACICRAVWSLAVLQACTPELWTAAMAALAAWHAAGSRDFDEGFAQLHDAAALLAAERPQWALELPAPLAERGARAVRSVRDVATCSKLQSSVADALRTAGEADFQEEYVPQGWHQPIDIALPGERIAIEVDGPFHFTVNALHGRRWPLGRTGARNRLLRSQGWRLLEVEGAAWEQLARSERPAWLASRLAELRQGGGG